MGNYYTRTIRIYPKNKNQKLDKDLIIKSIVESALLDNGLNVLNNDGKNYIDLCFSSKRGSGDLGIDLSTVDVWEIQGGDGTRICLNTNRIVDGFGLYFFSFDEIEIKGDISKLDDLINDIFPRYDPRYEKFPLSRKNEIYCYKVNGIYSSGSYYGIGNEENKINNLDKKDFLKLKGQYNRFEGCITSSYEIDNLVKVYQRFNNFELSVKQDDEFYLGLDYLQLNYKGRAVFQIKSNFSNPYQKWIYKSSNWWDNCVFPEWIEYKTKSKYAW